MPAPVLDAALEDQYLGELFDGLLAELAHRTPGSTALRPVLHLLDEEDAFVVTLPVPGVALEDLSVAYADGVLTICGPHLYRSVYLPDAVEAARLSIALRAGVLTVEVPRAPIARPFL